MSARRYKAKKRANGPRQLVAITDSTWIHTPSCGPAILPISCSHHTDVAVSTYLTADEERLAVRKGDQFVINTEIAPQYGSIDYCEEIIRPVEHVEDPLFYLCYQWGANYQHWLIEDLPRIWMYLQLKEWMPDLKVLVHEWSTKPWAIEALSLLGIHSDQIIVYKPHQNLKVRDLFVSGFLALNNVYISHEAWEIYTELRDVALKISTVNPIHQAYISRRDTANNWWHQRSLTNEDELVNIAAEFGFVELIPANYKLVDEIALFAKARKIIGPVGAGMANLVWLQEDRNVTVLEHPKMGAFCDFLDYITSYRRSEFNHASGGELVNPDSSGTNQPWRFSTESFREHISSLLSNPSIGGPI